ncbi:MAG TPA: nuclear transport factor 2 family protein [Terriglobales bacterium]|nr:nuclear transport factor 2 family protein [Terriglobales bacterium]
MKKLALALVVLLVVGAAAQTDKTSKKSASSGGSVEQQLIQAEKDWAQAIVKGDAAGVARFEADDITTTQDDGSVTTKKDDLDNLKSGDTKYTTLDESDFKVREYGNVAVVTGSYHTKGTNKGKEFEQNGRFTDTWVKRNGRWQAVASQDTLIAK